MKGARTRVILGLFLICCFSRMEAQNANFKSLQAHFERNITARFNSLFDGVETVGQWEARKAETRAALYRMLWHDRRWPEGPPAAGITRKEKKPDYTVECLVVETAPGLFSTANLYLPATGAKPFPVILYQCGHANKSYYKHHGTWFASRGIAVMLMDNIEMGEIEITHHGVYSNAWFHWYSRGFSPLAVELWNARRLLDYICSRDDLDHRRIGATGRSGGGMTTFFLPAVDDRIKASAPVSGAISTLSWIRDQLSSAHCDCQYQINSYGLLYSEIGALAAPRPQLVCNADSEGGFPEAAVHELVDKMKEIYRLYDAEQSLGTAIVPGRHADTEVIRLPVYSFFLKELLGIDTVLTEEGPLDTLRSAQLACWQDGFPLDERLTRIDEELIPAHCFPEDVPSGTARDDRLRELTANLREEVFRYFPSEHAPFESSWQMSPSFQGRNVRKVSFNAFKDLRVQGVYSVPEGYEPGNRLPAVLVIDHRRGIPVWGNEQPLEGCQWGDRAVLIIETLDLGSRALEENLRSFRDDDPLHHMKRQAMVAGTTVESMQLYEVLRSVEFMRTLPEVDPDRITIAGKGESGVHGLYAALIDAGVEKTVLCSPPSSHRQGPCYLNILRFTDIPEVVLLMGERVGIYGEVPLAMRLLLAKNNLEKKVISKSLADFLN